MNWRRRVVWGLVIVVVVGLLVWGFRPRPVLVDTEPVSRGPLAVTVEEEGQTRVRDRFVISAPVPGQTRRILLEAGDRVEAGDLLVIVDAQPSAVLDLRRIAEAEARVAAAEAALEGARQEVEAARAVARFSASEERRLRQLAAEKLVADREVEAAAAEAQRAKAQQRSAEFRVRTAGYELEAARTALAFAGGQDPQASGSIELLAPVSGQILRRHFESARVVQPGEPILEIGDPAALEVEIDVLSSDAVRIEPGMRVLFERWGRPEPLEGRVRRIEPSGFTKISALGVEEQRVLVIADFTSPREEWARLGDAFRVNARFILWEADDVLRVPTSALFRHGSGWAVFIPISERARLQPVEIGPSGGGFTMIASGLEVGEEVIVHPGRDIEDGVRVQRGR